MVQHYCKTLTIHKDSIRITLISLPVLVKNFNFAERSLLKFGGAQYCSCRTPHNSVRTGKDNKETSTGKGTLTDGDCHIVGSRPWKFEIPLKCLEGSYQFN